MISHNELSNINQKKLQDQTGLYLGQRDEGQESKGHQIPQLGCGVGGGTLENLSEPRCQGVRRWLRSGSLGCRQSHEERITGLRCHGGARNS